MSHSSKVRRAYQMWLEENPDPLKDLFKGFVLAAGIEKKNKQITLNNGNNRNKSTC